MENSDLAKFSHPVRVCFVIDDLALAGTELQLLQLIQNLDRREVLPFLCILKGEELTSCALEPADIKVIRLRIRRLNSIHAFKQAREFWRFLRRERIDVVQTFFVDSTRFAAPIAKAAGVNSIFGSRRNIGHSLNRCSAWIASLYNRLFIDKIIANCEAAKQAVVKQEGAKPNQVVVVRNGIALERFEHILPWNRKDKCDPMRIGMVGNLRHVKGPDLFVRAAQLVHQHYPDTAFEIAGDGDPALYEGLVDVLGLNRRVRFLGKVTDIPSFLATLDVAVLPSRAEGLSNALLEYMAAGRPIVATNLGGSGEVIVSETHGLLVDSNERSLALAIVRLLEDPALAHRLAGAAAGKSREFAMERQLGQWLNVYRCDDSQSIAGEITADTTAA